MKKIIISLLLAMAVIPCMASRKGDSDLFEVKAGGKKVPVYEVKVSPKDSLLRMKGMDDKKGSAAIYELAAFCTFDIDKPTMVTVKADREVESVKVLPSSRNIKAETDGREITFEAVPGDRLTVEINGDEYHSLHVFANTVETEHYDPSDPDVIYFGPGVHHVSHLVVRSGQTLYIAEGAILYGEMFQREKDGPWSPVISLIGDHIKVRGRGIINGSLCETLTTNLMYVNGNDISIEGVIFVDSSVWTVPVKNSSDVDINNVKLLGYRANSDGIDICNSRNVTVRNSFIRTLDDLIVIKTTVEGGKSEHIHAYGNILWNEVAHAVSVGAEINKDINDVVFEDNDIIHDKGREWTMRVYHCDNALVTNVVFRNLRIEESQNFISLWINKAVWSHSTERGHINGVTFENISAERVANPIMQFLGYDSTHMIENVTVSDVTVNGKKLTEASVRTNEFVKNITIK